MCSPVIPSCNAPPVFELGEQVFDFVPGLVERLAVFGWILAVSLWRDARSNSLIRKCVADIVAVITFVANQRFRLWQVLQQHLRPFEIAALAFGEIEPNRTPLFVTQGV